MAIPFPALRRVTESAGVYLTNDRVVHATGDDARSWLNGQISNDVRTIAGDEAVYALALTAKGRIVTDLWALAEDAGMAIVLPGARLEAALERFDKHIIMEDVELAVDDAQAVVTVQGPRAREVMEAAGTDLRSYPCPRLGGTGFDLWVPRARLDATLDALGARATELGGGPLDDAAWAAVSVALGVPRLGQDFGEDAYPQEAGLGARAVSFSKGCYLGQEVVYMLEKRGQVARRAVVIAAEPGTDAAQAAPGAQVSDADGKRIGELTSVSSLPDGAGALALAYLKRAFAEPDQTVWLAGSPWRVVRVVGGP